MSRLWILAAVLIIAINMSACGDKAIEEKQQQGTQESSEPDGEASNSEYKGAFKIPDFTSYDLYDNEVTNNFFADNKLTVVNVWTTT